jgi:hypothetical protein
MQCHGLSNWVGARKQNEDLGKVLAAQCAAALLHGCLQKAQKRFGIALDTAGFVRHVPEFPRVPEFMRSHFAKCLHE